MVQQHNDVDRDINATSYTGADQFLGHTIDYEPDLYTFDQLQTGTLWFWTRHEYQERFQRYHDGDLKELTTVSQLSSKDPLRTLLKFNYFRPVSDFYVNGLFSNPPKITSTPNSVRNEWFEENERQINRQSQQAYRWYSMMGRFILLVDTDPYIGLPRMTAVSPRYYYPIRDEWDQDRTIGHMLAYEYRAQEPYKRLYYDGLPDRLRCVMYSEELGVDEVRTYILDGKVIGELINVEPGTGILGVVQFGRGIGHSDYRNIEGAVANQIHVMSKYSSLLKSRGRWLQVPQQAAGKLKELDESGTETTLLSAIKDQPEYKFVEPDDKGEDYVQNFQIVQDYISMATGIPQQVYGINTGKGESGEAREKLMLMAYQRIANHRAEVEDILKAAFDMMNVPAGPTEFQWSWDAFSTPVEEQASAVELKEAGIITTNEARVRLGLEELDEGELAKLEQSSNPMMNPSPGQTGFEVRTE